MSADTANLWQRPLFNSLDSDLQAFRQAVDGFRTGQLSDVQFRALRVPMGVYEQRESGTYMVRVRLPAGGILPTQMRRVAELSAQYGDGSVHLTTRQDIQIHRVLLRSLDATLSVLAAVGLASKGGGGNTVRNITGCCDAGVCPKEYFDVSPDAIRLSHQLLQDRLSFELPRKYKLAFSGCDSDCAGATVSDLGFVAAERHGSRGYSVYIGGGLGHKAQVATLLYDFVPTSDVYTIAEAVKRTFDKHGDRKNKNRARLRFLVKSLGLEKLRVLIEEEASTVRLSATNVPMETEEPKQRNSQAGESAPEKLNGSHLHSVDAPWRRLNVRPQKQPGFHIVDIPLQLGDISGAVFLQLADVVAAHGSGVAVATQSQNLQLRFVPTDQLPSIFAALSRLGLASGEPAVLKNLVACAGASTCRLGICLSRGLAKAIRGTLLASDIDLEQLGDVKINISGCPNSCGRHAIADIGLHGAARRSDTGLIPHYVLSLGGRTEIGNARLAGECGSLPAKNVPQFLEEYLRALSKDRDVPRRSGYWENEARTAALPILDRYQQPPQTAAGRAFHSDWDTDEPFSLAGRGAAECGAGVFDLIEVDLNIAQTAANAGQLRAAVIAASRALLVTRGEQPKTEQESLESFHRLFILQGLVDQRFSGLVLAAADEQSSLDAGSEAASSDQAEEVVSFVASVKALYAGMDASLRFAAAPTT